MKPVDSEKPGSNAPDMPPDHMEPGQFIPHVYHYNMLTDQARMEAFRAAIALAVPPGSRVLELGGGTAVLSFFAAQRAAKVWCVEKDPELVREARRILALNCGGERVEVIEADAFDYLPPEPVDVVICEMIHVAMLREQQIPVIASFKQRYLEKFGAPLPVFVPEAFIQAVQPVHQSFNFEGYYAPAPLFQAPDMEQNRTWELGKPVVYQMARYAETLPGTCGWEGKIEIEKAGALNALRFITKNTLAIIPQDKSSIDWHSQYLIVPLDQAIPVEAGQRVRIRFDYAPGDAVDALRPEVLGV